MTEPAIFVNKISKSFEKNLSGGSIFEKISSKKFQSSERLAVLNDISFDVKKGELIGVIGKNGIGKTTLLRIISGIYRPDSGNVIVNGKLAMFLELGAGFELELSAKDNIILQGMILGFKKDEIKKLIPNIIKFAGLENFLDAKLKHFSSGMFARLAFSIAIQMNYDIFLIDELLAVGDEEFQKKSFDTFMDFKKKGKTFVVVSHNHDMLQRISDRMILLHNGKIQAIGTPQEVMNEYNRSVRIW